MSHLMDDPLPEGMFATDEAAIIVFARASAVKATITDEIWSGLTRHFDVKAILDIIFLVGLNQMVSRMHDAVQTDVDSETLEQYHGGSCSIRLASRPGAA